MSKLEKDWTDRHRGLFSGYYLLGLIGSLLIDIWFYSQNLGGLYILLGIISVILWISIMGTKKYKIAYIYVFLVWPMMIPLTIALIIKGRLTS